MDGHFQGRIIFLLGRFVFVVMLRAFLFIFTPQAQKVRGFDLKRSQCSEEIEPVQRRNRRQLIFLSQY